MKEKYRNNLRKYISDDEIQKIDESIEKFAVKSTKNWAINELYSLLTQNSYYEKNMESYGLTNVPQEALPIIFRAMRVQWEATPIDLETGKRLSKEEIDPNKTYKTDTLYDGEFPEILPLFEKLNSECQSFISQQGLEKDAYVICCRIIQKCKWKVYSKCDWFIRMVMKNLEEKSSDYDHEIGLEKLGFYFETEQQYILPVCETVREIIAKFLDIKIEATKIVHHEECKNDVTDENNCDSKIAEDTNSEAVDENCDEISDVTEQKEIVEEVLDVTEQEEVNEEISESVDLDGFNCVYMTVDDLHTVVSLLKNAGKDFSFMLKIE